MNLCVDKVWEVSGFDDEFTDFLLTWLLGSYVLQTKHIWERIGGRCVQTSHTCSTLVKKQTVARATLTTRNSFWLTEGSLPAAAADDEEEEVEATAAAAAAVEGTSLIIAVVRVDSIDGAPSSPDIVVCCGAALLQA